MNSTSYQQPVDKLLTLGLSLRLNMGKQEYDYILELGLGSQHIPDLIRMGVDRALLSADSGSLDVWAAVHAWRVLGQLHAEDAIAPLMQLFHELADNELVSEELPKVFSKIGAAAISPLATYLADDSYQLFSRVNAINSLEEIAKQNENVRNNCILVLTQQLKYYKNNSPELNAFIVAALINLAGKSSANMIKLAFAENQVAEDIVGSWEEVKECLGIASDEELQELQVVKVTIPTVEIQVPIPAVDIETEVRGNLSDGMLPQETEQSAMFQGNRYAIANDFSVEINAVEELSVEVAEVSLDNSEEVNIVNHDLLVTEEVLEEAILDVDVIPEVEITVEQTQAEVNVVEVVSNLPTQDEIDKISAEIIEETKAIKKATSVDITLVESNDKEEIRGFGKVGKTKDKDKDKEKDQSKSKQKKKKRNFVDL
jgi:Protein of unknown function (DUF1186)